MCNSPFDNKKLYVRGLEHVGGPNNALGYLHLCHSEESYSNENGMQVGYGWLKDNKEYNKVRDCLKRSKIIYKATNLLDLEFKRGSLITCSNIFSFIKDFQLANNFIEKVNNNKSTLVGESGEI